MKTHVDKFGRVVIPKLVRIHLGLRVGSILRIEESERAIRLTPVQDSPGLLMKEGVLVFSGQAVGDLTKAVTAHRHERLDRLARHG